MELTAELVSKRETLIARLSSLGRTLVAYSGGADSAFLAWAAHEALGDNMMAVIADSPSLARFHDRRLVLERMPGEVGRLMEAERVE